MKTSLTWVRWNRTFRTSGPLNLLIPALVAFAAIMVSCAGSGDSSKPPDWVFSYPADDAYYIGIAGSNTGSLAEDREKAAAAARADLASQISTEVRSELNIESSISSGEELKESVQQTISESVEQNLQSVEIVDSWASPEQGTWVYVRLSKAAWAAIVNREIGDLTLRANTALRPLADGSLTEAEEMSVLGRTRVSLLESPWGPRVRDEVLGTGGFLVEAVDGAIAERGAGLILSVSANPERVEYGDTIRVSGTVTSRSGRNMGTYPLIVGSSDGETVSLTTGPDGRFSIAMAAGDLGLNDVAIVSTADLAGWGIPAELFPITATRTSVFVAPVPAVLVFRNESSGYLDSREDDIREWLTDLNLPVDLQESGVAGLALEFAWQVTEFTALKVGEQEYIMRNVDGILTVSRDGIMLGVYEIDGVKDGGNTVDQALQRSLDYGLLVALEDRGEEIRSELMEILAR